MKFQVQSYAGFWLIITSCGLFGLGLVWCRCPKYDQLTTTCCRGKLYSVPYLSCCGYEPYNSSLETCCRNFLSRGANLSCCGTIAFNTRSHTCCDNNVFVGPDQNCSSATNHCPKGSKSVVGCYKRCTCSILIVPDGNSTKIPQSPIQIPKDCATFCSDCFASQESKMIGCPPTCDCDAENSYFLHENGTCVTRDEC
uniref:Galaxin-like repeats domain-containing protein n=1 Tax=Romanomermis culicivorax TaxID=13658 RepID=A0A915I0T5_ROMCU